jgi:hypothetical protein
LLHKRGIHLRYGSSRNIYGFAWASYSLIFRGEIPDMFELLDKIK